MYETPGVTINEQHEKLIQLLTDMCDHLRTSTASTEHLIIPKFAKFLVYLERHFEYENSIMEKSNYFDYDNHSKAHAHVLELTTTVYRDAMNDPEILRNSLPSIARAIFGHIELETALFKKELLPNLRYNSAYAEFS